MSLAGKVAIVTGGSRGIGYGIVLELAQRGAKVLATYTSPGSEKAVNELRGKAEALKNGSVVKSIQIDLSDPNAPKAIVDKCMEAFESDIDILVNNAAILFERALPDITAHDFDNIFHINVRAALLMIQAVVPHLRRPGRIINISSVGARSGFARMTLYTSSKAALEGITRSLAGELGPAGHTVNAIEPGPTESDMIDQVQSSEEGKKLVAMQKDMTPVEHRMGTPNDIACVVAMLAEEQSRWITGQSISASGGFTMI